MTNRVSKIISDQTLSRIIQIESGGRPNAKARTSSATGLGQFLNPTWMAIVQKHRPDWLRGRTKAQVLALRLEPAKSIEMLARFTEDNAAALGAGWTDGDLYLAHFSGVGVARSLMRAAPSTPCSTYYSSAAIAANRSILAGKTCGQVRAWAASRMAASGKTDWISKYWPANATPPATAPTVSSSGAKKATTSAIVAGTAGAGAAAQAGGFDYWLLIPILVVGVSLALVTWFVWPRKDAVAP